MEFILKCKQNHWVQFYFLSLVLITIHAIVKRQVFDKKGVISFKPYFEIIRTKFVIVPKRTIFIIHLICFSYFEKKTIVFFFFFNCIISFPLLSVIPAFSRNSNAFSFQSFICSWQFFSEYIVEVSVVKYLI